MAGGGGGGRLERMWECGLVFLIDFLVLITFLPSNFGVCFVLSTVRRWFDSLVVRTCNLLS